MMSAALAWDMDKVQAVNLSYILPSSAAIAPSTVMSFCVGSLSFKFAA